MPRTLAATSSGKTLNPSLLALKPRQVLLSKPDMGRKENGDRDSKTPTLKPDQKVLLLRSVAQYLDRSGFSKTLNKFLSEAEIEKKDIGGTSLVLEEIFCKCLDKGDHAAGDIDKNKTEGEEINGQSKMDVDDKSVPAVEVTGKKKKQKTDESDGHIIVSREASKENSDNISSDDHKKKQKDKKKKGKESKSEGTEEKSKDESSESKRAEMENKPKDKKKKKSKAKSESLDVIVGDVNGEIEKESDKSKSKKRKSSETESIKHENNTSEEDEVNKVSKKRKRLEGEDTNEKPNDNKDDEDSKGRKKDEENNDGVEKTPAKQADSQENGNREKNGTKSAAQKSGKKQQNDSKEPKKPFQRVNVEEVEFIDERLQDNSYWAKDGAESGYGAKAQEVLGQVRGRDFRHEKTKKKRGSYRGWQIDLQSHSIKFDNSDEE